jgi:arsenate reductase (thioredoxin)
MNILVLCTGNSARSILLEAILRASGRVSAFSAGSQPKGAVHPGALRLLTAKGLPTDGLRSKSWDEFATHGAPVMDAVITVCGSAAGEVCPIWPGAPVRAHWGIADPAAAVPAQQPAAFERAFALLDAKAQALLASPVETMDAASLQALLNRIGQGE